MKEVKATEKATQKMTRDGAVAENLATGEATSISGREAETDLSADRKPVDMAEAAAERAADAHGRHKAKKSAMDEAETIREGSATRGRPSSRLQFTDEERASPDLQKAVRRLSLIHI